MCEQFVGELRSCISKFNPELVHAGPIQTCGFIAALTGFRPLLITSWGSDLLLCANKNEEWRHATEFALRSSDGFFCDSNAVREAALRFVKIPASRIAQFPWGLEQQYLGSPNSRSVQTAGSRLDATFICTRSWEPTYDVDVLLTAFDKIHKRNNRNKLLLIGDGSLRGQVREFIVARDLETSIITPGLVPASQMKMWFESADIYISCAQADGTSISLLEAMAAGLPAIVTDIPSNREWVSEPDNGWLAKQGSPEDFAEKMQQAVGLRQLQRSAIACRNQAIVAKRANWDENFPELMELYRTISAPHHGSDGDDIENSSS